MIKRLVLPKWAATMFELVDSVGCGALKALQNVDECVGPTVRISEWQEQQMDVIRHNHHGVEEDSLPMLSEAMSQYQVARGF